MEINNEYSIKKNSLFIETLYIRHEYVQCVIIAVYYVFIYIYILKITKE